MSAAAKHERFRKAAKARSRDLTRPLQEVLNRRPFCKATVDMDGKQRYITGHYIGTLNL